MTFPLDSPHPAYAVEPGSENPQQGLSGASVLIGEYGDSANSARVGILGPTRMNYRGNIASLRAVARYLSKSVNGN